MYHFCTITTADYLYKVYALRDSLRAIQSDTRLHVLCIDTPQAPADSDGLVFYKAADLALLPSAGTILAKYSSHADKLRWCLKPIFLRYLLEQGRDKMIYVDNDIYFHGDYIFLFDLLDQCNFLLTPHHYPRDPGKDQNWLEANFKVGLYNAGFVAVNTEAITTLEWWAACCAYRCEKNALRGTFDDQKYLDLLPIIDEKAHILRHKGCNIAEWNRIVISRSEVDGKIMLDGKYPLIFIHYTGTTVRAIEEGKEPHLRKSFDTYLTDLKKYKPEIKAADLYNSVSAIGAIKYNIWKLATEWGL